MTIRAVILLAAALSASACGQGKPGNNDGTSAGSAPAAAATPHGGYTLSGVGIEPGLRFGMALEKARSAADKAFGPSSGQSRNEECGAGPMEFVAYQGLQLAFQDGKFVGWSLGGRTPPLRTAGGLAIGTARDELGDLTIDEESSLGPEFSIGEVGGVLGEDDRVTALWAGLACQFR
ncbi:hypothetical protein [Sphingosinicella sp. BN140058]|uniref:hypothetical protein n=1 Tax=Sphingosinicella sp. BN140058 TaxID=1892855 RepID=UPI001010106B|nr:hypothetical protein [Sphingosinicella sp. BN140058]QAY76936.1 hypothetical protein ETR14_10835 [Sphingosinicella sp. BN140058]